MGPFGHAMIVSNIIVATEGSPKLFLWKFPIYFRIYQHTWKISRKVFWVFSGRHCPGTPRSVLGRCSPGHCRSTAYKRYNERRCICGDCANGLAGLVSGGMFPVIWRSEMFSRILRIHAPATTDDTGPCGHWSNVSKNVGFKHRIAHLVMCCRRFLWRDIPPLLYL